MTLLYSEGFDQYTITADLNLRYIRQDNGWSVYDPTGGRFGGGSVWIGNFSNKWMRHSFLNNQNVGTSGSPIHFALWWKAAIGWGGTYRPIIGLNSSAANDPWSIRFNNTGTIGVTRTNSNTVTFTSSAGLISLDTWYHLECKFVSDDSNGLIKVWLDGDVIIDVTGTDTNSGQTNFDLLEFWGYGDGGGRNYFDDPVVWDETGTDFNESENIGLHQIDTLVPESDESVAWAPTGAGSSNADRVNATGAHDGDTTYIEAATTTQEDRYNIADPATLAETQLAIAVHSRAKGSEVGTNTIKNLLRHGSTTAEGKEWYLSEGYNHYDDYYGKNPDTASNWASGDITNIIVGAKYET